MLSSKKCLKTIFKKLLLYKLIIINEQKNQWKSNHEFGLTDTSRGHRLEVLHDWGSAVPEPSSCWGQTPGGASWLRCWPPHLCHHMSKVKKSVLACLLKRWYHGVVFWLAPWRSAVAQGYDKDLAAESSRIYNVNNRANWNSGRFKKKFYCRWNLCLEIYFKSHWSQIQ